MARPAKIELNRELKRILNWGKNSEEFLPMLQECARIYREWAVDRYERYSKGGGDWSALSPRTIAAKRRKGSAHPTWILRDTDRLIKSVSDQNATWFSDLPNFSTGKMEKIKFHPAIHIGIGESTYPNGLTTDDVFDFHQLGKGRLPKREIFVNPPREVQDKMASAVLQMMMKAWGNG